VLSLYVIGSVLLAACIRIELRAEEPVLPLRLFRSSIFTLSNIASLAIAMGMFGAIFYIPVYAQGVLGVNATNSGAIIMPMSVAMILTSILIGLLITRTGRYKGFMVVGGLVMVAGFVLLARMHYGSTQLQVTLAMIVIGLGLGASMQTYTLVVQNTVARADLGVATSAVQFFRSVGGTVGIAVLGTIMTSRMMTAIPEHLPPGAAEAMGDQSVDAGSVLDPHALAQLPEAIAVAVRQGLADSLHLVFLVAIPLVLVAVVATVFIKAVPLRETLHPEEPVAKQTADQAAQLPVAGA
jgi:MFS family permease